MPKIGDPIRHPAYWAFPAILRSFKAVGFGKVQTDERGDEWRVRGGSYVLLSPPSLASRLPSGADMGRSRSLAWPAASLPDGLPRKPAGWTYMACRGWEPPGDTSSQRILRKAAKDQLGGSTATREELLALLDEWIAGKKAAKPTTIVVRGHYAAMIDDPGMRFRGYRDSSGRLLAAVGWTMHLGYACIGFAKHVYGTWWLARFVWMDSLRTLLAEDGCKGVVCGDTADRLKREIGLERERQCKVDWSGIK